MKTVLTILAALAALSASATALAILTHPEIRTVLSRLSNELDDIFFETIIKPVGKHLQKR